jgi:hypothetical protein
MMELQHEIGRRNFKVVSCAGLPTTFIANLRHE